MVTKQRTIIQWKKLCFCEARPRHCLVGQRKICASDLRKQLLVNVNSSYRGKNVLEYSGTSLSAGIWF